MFCAKCGKQLSDTQKFCSGCGWQVPLTSLQQINQQNIPVVPNPHQQHTPFLQQININVPQNESVPKSKWETARLVIGIITVGLFFLLQLQSCVACSGEVVMSVFSEEKGTSGETGFIFSFFFLIAGILSIVCRKSKGGSIAAGAVYAFFFIATIAEDFSFFQDLAFYCFLSFVFGAVMIIGGVVQKKL